MPHDDVQQDPVPTVPAVQQAPAVPAEAKAASPPEAKAETAAGIARPNSMGSKDQKSDIQDELEIVS